MTCCLKRLGLYRLAKVILEHTTYATLGSTDNNISKTNIVLQTGRTAANANQQTDPDAREGTLEIFGNSSSRGCAIFPRREPSHNDIVLPDSPQCVIVVVIVAYASRSAVGLVEESLCGNILGIYGADPANSVFFIGLGL